MQQMEEERVHERLERRKLFLSQLREAYRLSDHTTSTAETNEDGAEDEDEREVSDNVPQEEAVVSPAPVLSVEELFVRFKSAYEEQLSTSDVESLSDSGTEVSPKGGGDGPFIE